MKIKNCANTKGASSASFSTLKWFNRTLFNLSGDDYFYFEVRVLQSKWPLPKDFEAF